MRTITAEALSSHLHATRAMDADEDALCSRERIMLDYAHAIPLEMDNLTTVEKSSLLSKTVEFEDRSVVVSAVPQVDLKLILKYVRLVSSSYFFFWCLFSFLAILFFLFFCFFF